MPDQPDPAAPAAEEPKPVRADSGRTAVVTEPLGIAKWLPVREAKAMMDAGQARRATPQDCDIAGIGRTAPDVASVELKVDDLAKLG